MVDSIEEIREFAELVVVGNSSQEFQELLPTLSPAQRIIDLVRLPHVSTAAQYQGIAW
jgi:hypothetical protein